MTSGATPITGSNDPPRSSLTIRHRLEAYAILAFPSVEGCLKSAGWQVRELTAGATPGADVNKTLSGRCNNAVLGCACWRHLILCLEEPAQQSKPEEHDSRSDSAAQPVKSGGYSTADCAKEEGEIHRGKNDNGYPLIFAVASSAIHELPANRSAEFNQSAGDKGE